VGLNFIAGILREMSTVYSSFRDREYANLVQSVSSLKTVEEADLWLTRLYEWADTHNIQYI
jgi:hypothetical protein